MRSDVEHLKNCTSRSNLLRCRYTTKTTALEGHTTTDFGALVDKGVDDLQVGASESWLRGTLPEDSNSDTILHGAIFHNLTVPLALLEHARLLCNR